jgi:hypothetical protein
VCGVCASLAMPRCVESPSGGAQSPPCSSVAATAPLWWVAVCGRCMGIIVPHHPPSLLPRAALCEESGVCMWWCSGQVRGQPALCRLGQATRVRVSCGTALPLSCPLQCQCCPCPCREPCAVRPWQELHLSERWRDGSCCAWPAGLQTAKPSACCKGRPGGPSPVPRWRPGWVPALVKCTCFCVVGVCPGALGCLALCRRAVRGGLMTPAVCLWSGAACHLGDMVKAV